jgi:hypothetical protein
MLQRQALGVSDTNGLPAIRGYRWARRLLLISAIFLFVCCFVFAILQVATTVRRPHHVAVDVIIPDVDASFRPKSSNSYEGSQANSYEGS